MTNEPPALDDNIPIRTRTDKWPISDMRRGVKHLDEVRSAAFLLLVAGARLVAGGSGDLVVGRAQLVVAPYIANRINSRSGGGGWEVGKVTHSTRRRIRHRRGCSAGLSRRLDIS